MDTTVPTMYDKLFYLGTFLVLTGNDGAGMQ